MSLAFVFGINPFFLLYEKADPVSSKSLYRCLRVLDVFVYTIIIAKKMRFCQDFHRIREIQGLCNLLANAITQERIVQIGRN